jgi:hypothetical protein
LFEGEQTNIEDDISVLVLAKEIDLTSNPHIKPVCLPSSEGARPDEGWYVKLDVNIENICLFEVC